MANWAGAVHQAAQMSYHFRPGSLATITSGGKSQCLYFRMPTKCVFTHADESSAVHPLMYWIGEVWLALQSQSTYYEGTQTQVLP